MSTIRAEFAAAASPAGRAAATRGKSTRAQRRAAGRGAPLVAEDELRPDVRAALGAEDAGAVAAVGDWTPPEGLTAEQRNCLNYLIEVNGQDAYSSEASALGKLAQSEYLALPIGQEIPVTAPAAVGADDTFRRFGLEAMAQVYVLNKARAPEGDDAVKFALLRMEAVKMGWYCGQREVVRLAPLGNAVATMLTDLQTVRDKVELCRTAAFLIPLCAEHTFRTMGHHFISGQTAEYVARYSRTLRAAMASDVEQLLRPPALYHTALHWVSPARARSVLDALMTSPRIPDAIKIRANAAPAGTALVTTTAAIMAAMQASNLLESVTEASGLDLAIVTRMAALVKQHPVEFHKTAFAYGAAAASAEELEALEAAKAIAIQFAPVAQGFVDALMHDAALGQAKALLKHAQENPILRRRSVAFFRAISRGVVRSAKELYRAEVVRVEED